MSETKREIVGWAVGKSETIIAMKDSAIETYLDECDRFPTTLHLYGYARMHAGLGDCGCSLDDLIERLDEEYGDPDGNYDCPITDKMREAEKIFHETVLSEYAPWACEEICEEDVDVQEWIKRNRPDWLSKERKP